METEEGELVLLNQPLPHLPTCNTSGVEAEPNDGFHIVNPRATFFDITEDVVDWFDEAEAVLSEFDDDDGFVPTAHVDLAAAVLASLRVAGIWGEKLVLQQEELPELLTQVLTESGLEASYEARAYVLSQLDEAVESAKDRLPMSKRARLDMVSPAIARTLDVLAAHLENLRLRTDPTVGPAVLLPTRGLRRPKGLLRPGVDDQTRILEEAEEFRNLQLALVGYLMESEAPCTRHAALTADPIRTLMNVVGKTRLNTAKKYLKIWKNFRGWLLLAFGTPWPTAVSQLIDYLQVLREEPCRPTVPTSWYQALKWMFRRADYEGDLDISRDKLLQFNLEKISTELVQQPLKQAARIPVVVLAALEVYVMDKTKPVMKRIHAGGILFRVWGTLRFDDMQRIRRRLLRVFGDMTITELLSTKTTGPGKRVRQLPVAVSHMAYIVEQFWQVEWLELISVHLPADKDYLLEVPSKDFRSGTGTRLRHAQSTALTHLIVAELTVPILVNGIWTESDTPILPHELADLFSEHSPRCVLPSVAILVEDDQTKRDCLGRWKPSGSDDYVRTYRSVVTNIQLKVAISMRAGSLAVIREWDVIDRASRHLKERKGFTDDAAKDMLKDLQCTLENFVKYLREVYESIVAHESVSLDAIARSSNSSIIPIENSAATTRQKVRRTKLYLVTYSKMGKVARLHRTDKKCYWAGVEVRDCQLFDEVDSTMYNRRCKFCWPGLISEKELKEDEVGSSDSSGSSDSD